MCMHARYIHRSTFFVFEFFLTHKGTDLILQAGGDRRLIPKYWKFSENFQKKKDSKNMHFFLNPGKSRNKPWEVDGFFFFFFLGGWNFGEKTNKKRRFNVLPFFNNIFERGADHF